MNIYAQPNGKTIKDFCRNMEAALLAALERGDPICLSDKMYTEDITAGFGYSPMIVDAIYRGARLTAEIGEPATKRIGKSFQQTRKIGG